jgi:peptide/nickel transport system substrate-binding protein
MAGELGTSGLYQSYLGGAEIEALDEQTVRIVLREPMADLLDLLMDIPIVARSGLDSLPDVHVGSGPYRLAEADSDRVRLEGFSKHWAGQPPIDTVHWRAEPRESRRVEALLAGEADLVAGVAVWSKQKIDSYEATQVVASEHGMCVIFMCNAQSGVCADKRVRQALNYALDVAEIIDKVKGGAGRPLNGPLTPLHFGYDPATPPYPYDPVEAKKLLAEAGHAGGLQLTLDIPTSMPDEAPHLAQVMFQQFARVGITTKVNAISDRPKYADMARNKQIHDACCFDSTPLSSFRVLREKLHSGVAGPWWQGYSSRAFDQLIDRAQATPDSRQRQELYRRAYRAVREDAPWIFLYNPILFWGVGPRAHGWEPGIEGLVRLA